MTVEKTKKMNKENRNEYLTYLFVHVNLNVMIDICFDAMQCKQYIYLYSQKYKDYQKLFCCIIREKESLCISNHFIIQ